MTSLNRYFFCAILLVSIWPISISMAQNVPVHAQGLEEELIAVDLSDNKKQAGVYSIKKGAHKPTKLAVLLPGYPSVVRPVVENGVMTGSKLTGNFLIRARRFLVDDSVASLIVDCQSESGDSCASSYQASKQRQEDVDKLIAEVKKRTPSITEVWLIGAPAWGRFLLPSCLSTTLLAMRVRYIPPPSLTRMQEVLTVSWLGSITKSHPCRSFLYTIVTILVR